MAEVKLGGVKTWQETLDGMPRFQYGPDDLGRWTFAGRPRFTWGGPVLPSFSDSELARRFRDDPGSVWLVGDPVQWTVLPELELDPPGTFAAIVRAGVLAAHPWLRYPLDPERPAVREVRRPAIRLERVLELVDELVGDDASRDVIRLEVERGGITVELYARRPDGSRFAVDGEVARDRIVIPIVGGE